MKPLLFIFVFVGSGAIAQVKDAKPVETKPAEVKPTPIQKYEGVIIDAKSVKFLPCMSPKIHSNDGKEVWGTFINIDSKFVNDVGIASFAKTVADAQKYTDRGAPNQAVIKALKVQGSFFCDAVIDVRDAAWLREINTEGKFLEKFKVTFVY